MSRVALAVSMVLMAILPALAADQVLPGKKLVLKQSASRATAVLIIQDSSIVLPAAGNPEDPSTAGLRVVLVGGTAGGTAELLVPPGAGWSVKTGTRTTWTWKNAAARPWSAGSSDARTTIATVASPAPVRAKPQ